MKMFKVKKHLETIMSLHVLAEEKEKNKRLAHDYIITERASARLLPPSFYPSSNHLLTHFIH